MAFVVKPAEKRDGYFALVLRDVTRMCKPKGAFITIYFDRAEPDKHETEPRTAHLFMGSEYVAAVPHDLVRDLIGGSSP